jgi:hypothetical protein
VVFSQFDEGRLYATFDGHKDNNFVPYIYRSADYGKSWTSITGDMPEFGSTRVIREHPKNENLLFVGTEFGVFVSITGGDHWVPLKNNLPTIAVHDIVIHPRENDLVIGTHGRGFWILDDISVFAEMTSDVLESDAKLFPVRKAIQFHDYDKGRGFMGARYYRAENPPRGTIITYYVNPRAVTPPKKDAEKETNGQEDEPKPPTIALDILNSAGKLIRRIDVPQGKKGSGIQRLVWDMRHAPPYTGGGQQQPSFFRRGPAAPWVLPGEYQVRLKVGDNEQIQEVTIQGDPLIQMSMADRKVWHDTLLALSRLTGSVNGTTSTAGEVKSAMEAVQKTLTNYPDAPDGLTDEAERIGKEADAILEEVRGARGRGSGDEDRPPPISQLVSTLYFAIEASTTLPTDDQRRLTRRAHERLTEQVGKLNKLTSEDLVELNKKLDAAGVPWTPGRTIVLPPSSLLPPR